MKPQSLANKKWNLANPEKWNEINREQQAKFYENHKEECKTKMLGRYYYLKECKIFRNILID
jgi:hypothetical protein